MGLIPRSILLKWCRLACQGPVVRRALKYAVVVGAVLIAINHGGALLAGDVDRPRLLRMGLTIMVPYVVSALSSVGAIRTLERRERAGSPPCDGHNEADS